jgi:cytidyltransferase-like protein
MGISMMHHVLLGRYQPFHVGHLALLNHVAQEFPNDRIVVAIVNPDPVEAWRGDGRDFHRFIPKRNPLNYWERYRCISEGLKGEVCESRVVGIVPSPRLSVNFARAQRFLPPRPRQLVLRRRWGDEFEDSKVDAYRKQGEAVLVVNSEDLPAESQIASGSLVRALARLGNPLWRELIPVNALPSLEQTGFVGETMSRMTEQEAKDYVDYYCRHDSSGQLLAELLELEAEAAPAERRDAVSESGSRLIRALRSPVQKSQEEVRIQVQDGDLPLVDALVKQLLIEKKIRTAHHRIPTHLGYSEVVLTADTYAAVMVKARAELGAGE